VSSHYEVVFSVHLRDDIPPNVLDELRWHLGERPNRPERLTVDYGDPLLQVDTGSYLAGGEHASLERTHRYRQRGSDHHAWSFFARLLWLDDVWAECWWQVATWLAQHAETTGYAGFWREECAIWPTVLLLGGGHAYLATPGEQPRPLSSDGPPWPPPIT
jgi:hypothetical protein